VAVEAVLGAQISIPPLPLSIEVSSLPDMGRWSRDYGWRRRRSRFVVTVEASALLALGAWGCGGRSSLDLWDYPEEVGGGGGAAGTPSSVAGNPGEGRDTRPIDFGTCIRNILPTSQFVWCLSTFDCPGELQYETVCYGKGPIDPDTVGAENARQDFDYCRCVNLGNGHEGTGDPRARPEAWSPEVAQKVCFTAANLCVP
jgi:hypothetical protein